MNAKSFFGILLIALLCTGAGAGATYFLLAPKLGLKPVALATTSSDECLSAEGADTSASSRLGHNVDCQPKSRGLPFFQPKGRISHQIEGLIINPANTRGTRYLIISLEIEVGSEDAVKLLREHDAAIRHAIIQLISGKTVAFLSDVRNWDALRAELKMAIEKAVPDLVISDLMFPEYVIQ